MNIPMRPSSILRLGGWQRTKLQIPSSKETPINKSQKAIAGRELFGI
jgi:hypothetical protein